MNKLTKIGVSALAGSLAAVSVGNAGSMTVKGGATVSWTQNEGETTGNPLGMNSGLTFTGSGELDNGSTVTLTLTQADQTAYSAGSVTLAIPGFGTLGLDQSGGGIDRFDDMMPTAWEETNGAGLATTLNTVAGAGGSTNIEWQPSGDMIPDGTNVYIAYTPRAGQSGINDKASGGAGNNVSGSGWDIVVKSTNLADGLTAYAGYSVVDQIQVSGDKSDDQVSWAIGGNYAVGALTIGYEMSEEDLNDDAVSMYENTLYGVSYSVNDDLSISWGHAESEKGNVGSANVTSETDSIQVSYTMGGATFVLAQTSADDALYASGTGGDKDGRTLRMSLAF